MTLTKRELEDLNEALQEKLKKLTNENLDLTHSLGSATAQYRQLTERLTRLEQRYTRLKRLLTENPSENPTE
jgi:chromosome segregation ATPase